MKQGKIQGLRNKGICTLADIDSVASSLLPAKTITWHNVWLANQMARRAKRKQWLDTANNPINNPGKKARLDALRAIWKKVKNDT